MKINQKFALQRLFTINHCKNFFNFILFQKRFYHSINIILSIIFRRRLRQISSIKMNKGKIRK